MHGLLVCQSWLPSTRCACVSVLTCRLPIVSVDSHVIMCLLQIDKEGANAERAKQMLSEAGLLPEEWGGDTPMVPVR